MSMKIVAGLVLILGVGCTSAAKRPAGTAANPPMRPGGPNWEEVDRSSQRVRERERNKGSMVETDRKVEQGFLPMSEADYEAALDRARTEVRKEHPKMSADDVEAEATRRADEAKRRHESSFSSRASSTYEWKKSPPSSAPVQQ